MLIFLSVIVVTFQPITDWKRFVIRIYGYRLINPSFPTTRRFELKLKRYFFLSADIIMVLVLNGVLQDECPLDTTSLFLQHPVYRDHANQLLSIPIRTVSKVLDSCSGSGSHSVSSSPSSITLFTMSRRHRWDPLAYCTWTRGKWQQLHRTTRM